MNLFADSLGVYTIFNGLNGTACQQSLLNRWNVIGSGGLVFCESNKGARGNPGLTIGFGGAIAKTFPHRITYNFGIRFAMSCVNGVGGGDFISYMNDGQPLCTLQVKEDGSILVYGNGQPGTIIFQSLTSVVSAGNLTYIDLHATISGLTALTVGVEVFINGISIGTGSILIGRSAATLTNKLATFNRVLLTSGVNSNGQVYLSDLYLNDDLGGINDTVIANPSIEIDPYPLPNKDGGILDWIPDSGTVHFSRVNENPADADSSYVKSSTIGAIDSWGWEDLTTLTDTISAVQLSIFAKTTDEGNRGFEGTIGPLGAEEQTQPFGLNNDYTYHHQSFDLDPNGDIPWTPANFNAKEFGIKLIS